MEFHNEGEMAEQLALFEEEQPDFSKEEADYLSRKCNDVFACVKELDDEINAVSTGWKTSRMGKVDLTLIRLAVYEIRYEDDIPFKVSVNEAVELAKKYGTDDSPSFVNGILAKFA
jgi:N utilization substance protein B